MEQVSWQVFLNFLAVQLIVWAEYSDSPHLKWLQADFIWVRRAVVAFVATITAAGLVFQFEWASGDFILKGNIYTIGHAFLHIGMNYTGITGMYWVRHLYDVSQQVIKQIKVLKAEGKLPQIS